jgi:muramoyltetrapeptide carboxypeptidase
VSGQARKPRALRQGDRIAIVAPASPFARDEFDAGIKELRQLGFEPVYDDSVFARDGYVAGSPQVRAKAFQAAWADPSIAALVAARGGYGSVQMLPLLDGAEMSKHAKAFIGYSDNTSILTWLVQEQRLVAFHGPMLEGRFARGADGYDRDTFLRCLCRTEAAGEIRHARLEVVKTGEARGTLAGGTLTQLTASLGTRFAFAPPPGSILFLDEVGERPYRIDRMLMQLRLSGVLDRASALVFGELPKCDEPNGDPAIRATIENLTRDFRGPVLFGLPSGHTSGVGARVVTGGAPALVIEESAVS